MDFATVRKKLGNGSYSTLDQFEVGIYVSLFFDSWSCFFAWDMGLLTGSVLDCVTCVA